MFDALRGQHGASPPPPCGKATKGRMIKVESVLDRPLAPCRGSGAALANPVSHPVFRRQTECEPCTRQDQLFTYTAVT
jgi:hypothetical protein